MEILQIIGVALKALAEELELQTDDLIKLIHDNFNVQINEADLVNAPRPSFGKPLMRKQSKYEQQ